MVVTALSDKVAHTFFFSLYFSVRASGPILTGRVPSNRRLQHPPAGSLARGSYNFLFLSPPEGGLDLVTNRKGSGLEGYQADRKFKATNTRRKD